ncbi:MAG TPA: SPOR domain-containing protein, partial [Blastocatellia bacterium]
MRFRYFDFTEILVKKESGEKIWKVASLRIGVALAALFACLCPLTASAQARRINGYALQVAAMSSRGSADALAQGLSARGMNAYWVGGASYGASGRSALYRVRIGNFQTIASANAYAENLVGAGLLDAYAITAYEAPSRGDAISNSSWKIQTFAQKRPQRYPGRQFGGVDVIDVVATIGSRGWLLLSSESINLTMRSGNSAISRELSGLIGAVSSRGWALNNDLITKFLGASSPVKIVSIPSDIIAGGPIIPPGAPANPAPLNAAPPDIGRGTLSPPSSTSISREGAPLLGSRAYNSPPRLQGSIEMRGGKMYMMLRNTDADRVFSGVARISLSDDKKQQDVAPINVTVLPDKEVMFPVDEATLTNGDWILMVYDQNGAARLIRGASFAPPKKPAQTPAEVDSTELAAAQEAPPSYVTGIYDATNWTQPQVSPQAESVEPQTDLQTATDAQDAVADSQAAFAQATNDPGTVTAVLRQIAVTNENVTLE